MSQKRSWVPYLSLILGASLLLALGIGTYRYLQAREPKTPEQAIQIATQLNKNQDYQASLEILSKANDKAPNDRRIQDLFRQTFILYVQKEAAEGTALIQKDPKSDEGYAKLAKAYEMIDDHFKAKQVLLSGVMEIPQSSYLWLMMGICELSQAHEYDALAIFRHVLEFDAKNGFANNNIAYVLSRTDNPKILNLPKALQHARLALQDQPNNPNFLDTLAGIQFQMGHAQEAVQLIHQAIALDPQDPGLRAALVKFQKGR